MNKKILLLTIAMLFFGFWGLSEASVGVDTRNPGKMHSNQLFNRTAVCDNIRFPSSVSCDTIYQSAMENGERQYARHLSFSVDYSVSTSYGASFVEGFTNNSISSDLKKGNIVRFSSLSDPEGEWYFAGSYFDTPPIEWRSDSRSDYENMEPINETSSHSVKAADIINVADAGGWTNVFEPELGIAATDPMENNKITFQGDDKFETFTMKGDHYAIAESEGIGHLEGAVDDTHAYATIDNLWFDEGVLSGSSTEEDFSISENVHAIPEIDAGDDKFVAMGGSTTIDAEGYHPDGEDLYYLWECEEGSLEDDEAEKPTYNAPMTEGDYECRVVVYDDNNKGATDTVTMHVVESNPPHSPENLDYSIENVNDCSGAGSTPTLSFDYSDPDGDDMEKVEISFDGPEYETKTFNESASSGDRVDVELSPDWSGAEEWGEKVEWIVKVKNDMGFWSDSSSSTLTNRDKPEPELTLTGVEFKDDLQCRGPHSVPTFLWEYSHPDRCSAEYRIMIDHGGVLEGSVDHGDVMENTLSPNDWEGDDEWGESVNYNLEVEDEYGFTDNSQSNFNNLVRPYPQPALSWTPQEIHAKDLVEFTGEDESGWKQEIERRFFFEFTENSDPESDTITTTDTEAVSEVEFGTDDVGKEINVKLRITDTELGNSCKIGDDDGDIGEILHPLPEYHE